MHCARIAHALRTYRACIDSDKKRLTLVCAGGIARKDAAGSMTVFILVVTTTANVNRVSSRILRDKGEDEM